MRRLSPCIFGAALLALPLPSRAEPARPTTARLWAGGLIAAPRLPLVGDVNGDGRADLLAVFPEASGIIDLCRTGLGKPRFPIQARTGFGKDLLVAAAGRFAAPDEIDVLAVARDGSLHLASRPDGEGRYMLAGSFPAPDVRLPGPPVVALALRAAPGLDSLLLVDAKGNALRLASRRDGFDAIRLKGRLGDVTQLAASPDGEAFFWTDRRGTLFRTAIEGDALNTRRLLRGAAGEKLAVGRFSGETPFDVLLGQRILSGGDPGKAVTLPPLPDAAMQKGDFAWLAGDIDGDGLDDLIRVRRSGAQAVGDDIMVHFFRRPGPTDDTACSSGDGLLDAWKTGRIKPGGLDLAALGCKVGQKDIVVEVQRVADVPEELLRREMGRAVAYYATLGLTLHPIYREPIPVADSRHPWWELGERFHPAAHRGITHWMLVTNSGGGQSGEMEDRGSCGARALYATFLHEFGHQLGLDHTGRWAPAWCPTYPSLMNYAYSYQLGGKPDAIGYSDGRLAGLTIDERRLSEVLPLPPDKVAFLAGPPYHYRMKPTPDGRGTLIDWNWNGVFGEKSVSADINYGYSTTGGLRHTIGKTYTAPILTSHGSGKDARLLLIAGRLPEGASVPPSDAETKGRSLSPELPGRLTARIWSGGRASSDGDAWSPETTLVPDGVTGDASAATLGDTTWIAYPTAAGVAVRPVAVDDAPAAGEPILLPGTAGAQPTLTVVGDGLALLLWRDEKTPVGYRRLAIRGKAIEAEPERALAFTSRTPVAAVAGGKERSGATLWVGLFQDRDANRTFCGQVRRLALGKDGALVEVSSEWVGGESGGQRGQGRPILLWQPDRALESRGGQLWFLATGLFGKSSPWACHYVSTRIADASVNAGWLQRRYYDEWTQSRSAPGACFFRGEMVFASRWFGNVRGTENDNLFVAFYGRGFESEPMGDFNDIAFIRDIGLDHSILYRGE